MASYQVNIAKHATLAGTTVDMLSFASGFDAPVEILNTSGNAPLWVTYGAGDADEPDAYGDDTIVIPAGTGRVLPKFDRGVGDDVFVVKVLGSGNRYSVQKLRRFVS